LVTAWNSVSEEEQTQMKFIERLIKEEARLAAMDDATSTSTAITVQQKRGKENQHRTADPTSNIDKDNLETKKNVCYFCKKTRSDIVLKEKNGSKNNKSSEKSNVENLADVSAFIVSEVKIIVDLLDGDLKIFGFSIRMLQSTRSNVIQFSRNHK